MQFGHLYRSVLQLVFMFITAKNEIPHPCECCAGHQAKNSMWMQNTSNFAQFQKIILHGYKNAVNPSQSMELI